MIGLEDQVDINGYFTVVRNRRQFGFSFICVRVNLEWKKLSPRLAKVTFPGNHDDNCSNFVAVG